MNFSAHYNNLVYKSEHKLSYWAKFKFRFGQDIFTLKLQVPNENISPLKSTDWLNKFFNPSLMYKSTQLFTFYEKANKITTKKEMLMIEIDLGFENLLREINCEFTEPSMIACDHGYDILTKIYRFPLLIMLRDEELEIIDTYIAILKIYNDGKIYKSK